MKYISSIYHITYQSARVFVPIIDKYFFGCILLASVSKYDEIVISVSKLLMQEIITDFAHCCSPNLEMKGVADKMWWFFLQNFILVEGESLVNMESCQNKKIKCSQQLKVKF